MKGYVLVDVPEKCSVGGCAIYESCRQRYNPCPIKPLPGKKEVPRTFFMMGEMYGEEIGWNACLDEILEKGEIFDE